MSIEGSENVPEGDGMVTDHVPVGVVLTGSTGSNTIQDSSARAVIWMVLNGVLLFLVVEYDVFSKEGLAALETVILGLSYILGGLFDKFVKPRLASS